MIYPQGHFGTACVLLGALLVGCDDAPVGPPELRDAGIGHPPEEADAGFEPDAGVEVDAGPPPFDLGAHQKNHRCCDCLARALVPGGPCAAHGDCGVGMKCFCLDEDCTATQCGATADLGPEAAINAECRCANGDCSRLVCGVKCLIGEEDSCVEALDESRVADVVVRHRGSCLGACSVCDAEGL